MDATQHPEKGHFQALDGLNSTQSYIARLTAARGSREATRAIWNELHRSQEVDLFLNRMIREMAETLHSNDDDFNFDEFYTPKESRNSPRYTYGTAEYFQATAEDVEDIVNLDSTAPKEWLARLKAEYEPYFDPALMDPEKRKAWLNSSDARRTERAVVEALKGRKICFAYLFEFIHLLKEMEKYDDQPITRDYDSVLSIKTSEALIRWDWWDEDGFHDLAKDTEYLIFEEHPYTFPTREIFERAMLTDATDAEIIAAGDCDTFEEFERNLERIRTWGSSMTEKTEEDPGSDRDTIQGSAKTTTPPERTEDDDKKFDREVEQIRPIIKEAYNVLVKFRCISEYVLNFDDFTEAMESADFTNIINTDKTKKTYIKNFIGAIGNSMGGRGVWYSRAAKSIGATKSQCTGATNIDGTYSKTMDKVIQKINY